MRTIKFRAKCYLDESWVYGFVDITPGNVFILSGASAYRVRPETVGQFTGLTDKNGVEIYEGDILSFLGKPALVFYDNDASFRAKLMIDYGLSYLLYRDDQKTVVGNVHDNPGNVTT